MVTLRNFDFGRIHICIGRNKSIAERIESGIQKPRSFKIDRVPGMVAITVRVGINFINIDIF